MTDFRLKTLLSDYRFLLTGAGILAALLAWPGMHGTFLLDDFSNLGALSNVSRDALNGFWIFLESGVAGPTGRPVALLTFALQADSWPESAFAFKIVNLAIHIATGFLFYAVFRKTFPESRYGYFILIAVAWWLIHPINASTIFYVIQRMTQLSAAFVLLALLGMLIGRAQVFRGTEKKGLFIAGASFIVFGMLGLLTKENAVLLPLLALAIEYSRPGSRPAPVSWKWWRLIFIVAPLAAGGLYFLWRIDALVLNSFQNRDFHAIDRMMTEARILADYQWKLLVPTPSALGLYFDDYTVSRGLLSPPSTLLAILWHLGLLAAAFMARHRIPLFTIGILWFYAGHALEAGPLSLELYFEHRNYLPAFGFLLALTALLPEIRRLATSRFTDGIFRSILILLILMHALVMHLEARLWGNPLVQTAAWAEENPESLRAQMEFIAMHMDHGRFETGADLLEKLEARHPESPSVAMLQLAAACLPTRVEPPAAGDIEKFWLKNPLEPAPYVIVEKIIAFKERGGCTGIDNQLLLDPLSTLSEELENPILRREAIMYRARILRSAGRYQDAISELEQAYSTYPDSNFLLTKALWLMEIGHTDSAIKVIERAERNPPSGFIARKAFEANVSAVSRRLEILAGGKETGN